MTYSPSKNDVFTRLKHSLQALALPAKEQIQLFPDFATKTDELVLDFDHWRSCAVGNFRTEFTSEQLDSLSAIDRHIQNPSGDQSVWQEEALFQHQFWQELRDLAVLSLSTFGWKPEIPPDYKHEYVEGSRRKI